MWSSFLGFRSGVADGSIIPGCDATSQGISCPKFRDNVPVSNSELEMPKKNSGGKGMNECVIGIL